jgi:hypothetical protein
MRLIHQQSEHWVSLESRVARAALCGSLCAGRSVSVQRTRHLCSCHLTACGDAARQPRTQGARLKLWKYLQVRTAPRARVGVYRRNRLRVCRRNRIRTGPPVRILQQLATDQVQFASPRNHAFSSCRRRVFVILSSDKK